MTVILTVLVLALVFYSGYKFGFDMGKEKQLEEICFRKSYIKHDSFISNRNGKRFSRKCI